MQRVKAEALVGRCDAVCYCAGRKGLRRCKISLLDYGSYSGWEERCAKAEDSGMSESASMAKDQDSLNNLTQVGI